MGIDELADEMLMAYADGELDEDGSRRVEAAMAADAAVASRVVAFQRTRRLARAAFSALDDVPAALRLAVEEQVRRASGVEMRTAEVVPFPARTGRPSGAGRGSWTGRAAAMAAAVAAVAVAGVTGFYVADGSGTAVSGVATLGPDLQAALSTVAAGDTVPVSGGEVRLVQTFKAGDGALCREFRLDGRAETSSAIACRGGDAWQVRFAAVAPATAGGDYRPASGDDLLDGFLAAVGAGEVLDPAAEKAALDAIR